MLWFNFIFGLIFFQTSSIFVFYCFIFIAIIRNKGNTNQTGFKNFKPKIKLNHNMYANP